MPHPDSVRLDHHRNARAKVVALERLTGRSGGNCRLAEMASGGASMQFLRNAVFSAPMQLSCLGLFEACGAFGCLAAASLPRLAAGREAAAAAGARGAESAARRGVRAAQQLNESAEAQGACRKCKTHGYFLKRQIDL